VTSKAERPTRRSGDRKAQILAAAADHFHRSGYHATGVDDIAAAVGITAGGLYRHFRGKQELLSRVLLDGQEHFYTTLREKEEEGLDALLRCTATSSLDHRSLPMLLDQETRNLSDEDRASVLRLHAAQADVLARALCVARPDLGPTDAQLVTWMAMTVLGSPSYHRMDVPRPHFDDLLYTQASRVCRSPAPDADQRAVAETPPGAGLTPVSRREAVLAAAVDLFKRDGYQAVSMEDIGAAAGITGPSVYNHFASKAELLSTALHRESEVLQFSLARTLAESSTAAGALRRMLGVYAELSRTRISAAPLLQKELAWLLPAEQEALRLVQRGVLAECAALLRACRPELDETEARVTVMAAMTPITVVPRLPLPVARAAVPSVLAELAAASLGIGHED
jgi:AcrR family transcriptional regulator